MIMNDITRQLRMNQNMFNDGIDTLHVRKGRRCMKWLICQPVQQLALSILAGRTGYVSVWLTGCAR